MAKKSNKNQSIDLDSLSPEELKAKLAEQLQTNTELTAENKKLSSAAKGKGAALAPVTFEVEDDDKNDIEGGEYEFTCPTFTWDDNTVINVRKLAESKEKKDQELYANICAQLVLRKSGIVRRKETD